MWIFGFLETVWRDLIYGARALRKNPAFTLVAILTLALGIGANVAIFSITDEVLLSRLPVPHPEELAIFRSPGPSQGHTHSDSQTPGTAFSYPVYQALRDANPAFSGVLARFAVPLSVSASGVPEIISGELVSGNYFQVLGAHPVLGRVLIPQDETAAGANPVAVLSYGYWERRYAMSPSVLNQQISVNGTALTVVGVAQKGFTGVQAGEIPDMFIPVTMKAQMTPNWDGLADHRDRWLALIGRMKPGFTLEKAEAALQPFYHATLESELPFMKYSSKSQSAFLTRKLLLDPGSRGRPILKEQVGEPLVFLAIMVGLILLIACANLAGLLVANGEARQREISLRLSLGAGRRRIVRQLVTENLLLALGGGLAGLGLSQSILRALATPVRQSIGDLDLGARLDSRMLAWAVGASLATWLLFGLAPALRLVRIQPHESLAGMSGKATSGISNIRLRQGLMVFQVAMTVLLMAESGLFTQTLFNLKRADLGMRADHLVQFTVSPGLNHYTPLQTLTLVENLRKALLALPGVRGVGVAEVPLFADSDRGGNMTVEGYAAKDTEDPSARMNLVGPAYFAAMGIPLLNGREFTESDAGTTPKVAIINETMARRYFSGRNPLGLHFAFGAGNVHPDIEIVGLVKDSKHMSARDLSTPFAFLPYAQDNKIGGVSFYVRTAQEPLSLAAPLRRTLAEMDANLPMNDLKTLDQQLDLSMFNERALAFLSLCLGGLAALLAAIGLYGVLAYIVARRTREIGVRIALGATRRGIAWLVLREIMYMGLTGLGAGILLSLAAGRVVRSLLFGVSSANPGIMALTTFFLVGISLLAASLPARKAAGVDPMVALRYE